MPAISLVVCLHQQRDLLARLLQRAAGCHDDLVVVHDGPDNTGARAVVEAAGGRFFERPRAFQQEPHWPFAWEQAAHDWILRLDADEFPGAELAAWLKAFRVAPEPPENISGYTCIWPLWDGQRTVSKKWPDGRLFLFRKRGVRFFGMCEQSPIPDGRCEPLELILHHQPGRKSHGLINILFRDQSRRVVAIIANSLLGKPTDLICWRWESDAWPVGWEQIRQRPLPTAFRRLTVETLRGLRDQWRREKKVFPLVALGSPVQHALMGVAFWKLRRRRRKRLNG